jgi:hypothetical protein
VWVASLSTALQASPYEDRLRLAADLYNRAIALGSSGGIESELIDCLKPSSVPPIEVMAEERCRRLPPSAVYTRAAPSGLIGTSGRTI